MDRIAQSAIENFVADTLLDKYGQHITFGAIWSEVLLWSGLNRHKFSGDESPAKQTAAMYDSVAAYCERAKAEALGYETDDLWFYSEGHLRELVAQVCAGINQTRLDPAYADCERALYRLVDPSSRADIIGWHAGWHEDEERLTEALRALQGVLGGKRPRGL